MKWKKKTFTIEWEGGGGGEGGREGLCGGEGMGAMF